MTKCQSFVFTKFFAYLNLVFGSHLMRWFNRIFLHLLVWSCNYDALSFIHYLREIISMHCDQFLGQKNSNFIRETIFLTNFLGSKIHFFPWNDLLVNSTHIDPCFVLKNSSFFRETIFLATPRILTNFLGSKIHFFPWNHLFVNSTHFVLKTSNFFVKSSAWSWT